MEFTSSYDVTLKISKEIISLKDNGKVINLTFFILEITNIYLFERIWQDPSYNSINDGTPKNNDKN